MPGPQANPPEDTGHCEPDILTGYAVTETIRASGRMHRAKQAGHMTARNLTLSPDLPFPHRGRPHMSPKFLICYLRRSIQFVIDTLAPT